MSRGIGGHSGLDDDRAHRNRRFVTARGLDQQVVLDGLSFADGGNKVRHVRFATIASIPLVHRNRMPEWVGQGGA